MLQSWVPKVQDRVKAIPGVIDLNTDREQGGLQANVVIDRTAASRLGVRIQDIDNTLNNGYSQRQISTIYGPRNQYRVILEADPQYLRDPNDLSQVYVSGSGGTQVPLTSVARVERSIAPLVVNHTGPVSVGHHHLQSCAGRQDRGCHYGDRTSGRRNAPAGNLTRRFRRRHQGIQASAGAQPLLILAALIAVYIVLGVLYESLAHPLTIISTLPSAGLGALLALQLSGTELTVIAFIGIILLIGIVKKNGIMLVDFALDGERRRGLPPERAIREAALERFRPILMTTMAAMLGALPLVLATGPGTELRRPLGITIIGGLLVSQVLTLYTTPVIYLLLDRLHRRLSDVQRPDLPSPKLAPAE